MIESFMESRGGVGYLKSVEVKKENLRRRNLKDVRQEDVELEDVVKLLTL